jgi:hypothetical protein
VGLSEHLRFETLTLKALRGFAVEIWDWKRLDLSTDVIAASTKDAKEISLYSSGNYAVLMGWASVQGLPNVKKFPCVRGMFLCFDTSD